MTARTFAEAVAAVEHHDGCASRQRMEGLEPGYCIACDCDRDTRIAKKFEAALVVFQSERDADKLAHVARAAALRAFEDASA